MPHSVLMVCFIADPFDPPGHERFGGGHLFLFDLSRHLVRAGLHVTYLTRRNAPYKPLHQIIGTRCEIIRLNVGEPSEISLERVASLHQELTDAAAQIVSSLDIKPYVVHSHYWIAGLVCRELFGRRILEQQRHVHSILSLGRLKMEMGEKASAASSLRDAAELRVFKEADTVIAVCPSEESDIRRLYPGLDNIDVQIIPYGIDIETFQPRPDAPHNYVRRAYKRFEEGHKGIP